MYVAMILIAYIETLALLNGIDGVALSLSVCAISGLGGYQVKHLIDKIRAKNGESTKTDISD